MKYQVQVITRHALHFKWENVQSYLDSIPKYWIMTPVITVDTMQEKLRSKKEERGAEVIRSFSTP